VELVEKYKVTVMFSAPTAVRVLKKHDPAFIKKYDLSSLKALFLAGEPLDEPTATWISPTSWASPSSTTTGRPKPAGPSWPSATAWKSRAQQVRLARQGGVRLRRASCSTTTGEELTGGQQKGVVAVEGPLPPGCMQTIWGDDARFVKTYWSSVPARWCTAPSTGASATKTATTSSWAAPTT
jgi:propionyl-CoA synthetase